MRREAVFSAERGLFADKFIALLDGEKTIEAPVALTLQYYAFSFCHWLDARGLHPSGLHAAELT